MADKKSTDKNVRRLTKIGKKSIGLTLPIEEVRKLGCPPALPERV